MSVPPYTPQIAQCGAISIGTPALETSLHFFRDLLGMEEVERIGDTVYLRGYQELKHHSLVLFASEVPVVDNVSFRVQRLEDVELFYNTLIAQDVPVVELTVDNEAGRGDAIRFQVPHIGHAFELYYDISKPQAAEEIRSVLPSNSSKRRGLGVRRIDHFNIQATRETIGDGERWLRETLGFKRREYIRVPEQDQLIAAWTSVTPQVHDLAIMTNHLDKNAQLHHVAFNLENHSDLLVAADTLRDHQVFFEMGPGKHGVGQAMYLYLHEPGSGVRIELYAGGYFIFDPDWEAIEWTPATMNDGLIYWGDGFNPLDMSLPHHLTTSFSGIESVRTANTPVGA